MKLLRFEKKIIGAVVLAALGPLVGALFVGYQALDEAYGVGVNEEIHRHLQGGVTARRQAILALRSEAEAILDAIAFDPELAAMLEGGDRSGVEALFQGKLDQHALLAEIQLQDAPFEDVLVGNEERLDPATFRIRTLERLLQRTQGRLLFKVAVPEEVFRDFQAAGETEEMYARIRGGAGLISGLFLGVYILLLLSVIVVVMGAAVIISRRVTQRVAVLGEATRRLGAGDFTVQVPLRSDDEVSELTESFNTMVRDMEFSRQRIDFLQQISAWQDFARRLAHEIKNPLTPIQLAIQDLSEAYRGTDVAHQQRLRDVRDIIEEEVRTLRRLVGEFSDFARMPRAELQKEDLGGILADLSKAGPAILTDVPGADDIEIAVAELAEEREVMADAPMLRRALRNLVENGVQALAGRPGKVQVSVLIKGKEAWIEVHDSGDGIPEDEMERIFDPYFTTKETGTGLGLSIVKKIVFEHRAEITCSNSPLGGGCFRISLPLM